MRLGRGETFFDDLMCSDLLYHSDIAYRIRDITLVYEHDPGFWHREDRHKNDIAKTKKLLKHSDDTFEVCDILLHYFFYSNYRFEFKNRNFRSRKNRHFRSRKNRILELTLI